MKTLRKHRQLVADLLINICEYCVDKYQLPVIKLIFSNAQRSQLRYSPRAKQMFSLTVAYGWFYVEELAVASLLHELAHVRQKICEGHFSHNYLFRKLEIEMLADWGLKPTKYRKAYYSVLTTINGKFSWRK